MRIIVLAGGLSPESDVSLISGAGICKTLREKGHTGISSGCVLRIPYDSDKLEEVFDLPGRRTRDPNGISTTTPDLEALRKLSARTSHFPRPECY